MRVFRVVLIVLGVLFFVLVIYRLDVPGAGFTAGTGSVEKVQLGPPAAGLGGGDRPFPSRALSARR